MVKSPGKCRFSWGTEPCVSLGLASVTYKAVASADMLPPVTGATVYRPCSFFLQGKHRETVGISLVFYLWNLWN